MKRVRIFSILLLAIIVEFIIPINAETGHIEN